jgi:hypothetical protein
MRLSATLLVIVAAIGCGNSDRVNQGSASTHDQPTVRISIRLTSRVTTTRMVKVVLPNMLIDPTRTEPTPQRP